VRYARDGDFVLVTNDASDFRQLYATQPLHAGLIILIPVVTRGVQQRHKVAAVALSPWPGLSQMTSSTLSSQSFSQ
jgi:hypothetical protein